MVREYFIWLRNGVAVTFSWLVILSVLWQMLAGGESLPLIYLMKMLVLVVIGCTLFNVCFMKAPLKKISFYGRMNLFFAGIVVVQLAGAFWMGMFHKGIGSFSSWLIYSGILCILYGGSSLVYGRFRKSQGTLYTNHLAAYLTQQKK